jgi:glucose-6-phosphate dehydrogenase assembly protein OpcA
MEEDKFQIECASFDLIKVQLLNPAWWPARFKTQVSGFDRVTESARSISILKKFKTVSL